MLRHINWTLNWTGLPAAGDLLKSLIWRLRHAIMLHALKLATVRFPKEKHLSHGEALRHFYNRPHFVQTHNDFRIPGRGRSQRRCELFSDKSESNTLNAARILTRAVSQVKRCRQQCCQP